jgi:hypothetical protein
VPSQRIGIGTLIDIRGRLNLVPVKGIIVPAVLEFLPNARADLEPQIGCHGYVAGIEQAMDISPQKKSVSGLVHTAVAIGFDVCSIESW